MYVSESRSVLSHSLRSHGLYSPQTSPGKNTGVGSHSLLQGTFQSRDRTQVSYFVGGFFTLLATREALTFKNASKLCFQDDFGSTEMGKCVHVCAGAVIGSGWTRLDTQTLQLAHDNIKRPQVQEAWIPNPGAWERQTARTVSSMWL